MEYRRLKHRDTWHFQTACQHWRNMATNTYLSVDVEGLPTYGELCNECLSKERRRGTSARGNHGSQI